MSPGVLGEPIPHRKSTTRLTPGSITSWPCGYAHHGEAMRLLSIFTEHAADPSTYTAAGVVQDR